MSEEDLNFLEATDLDRLTREQVDQRNGYWFSRTHNERLQEGMRLNIAKWGAKVFAKGVDPTKFKVISFSEYRKESSK